MPDNDESWLWSPSRFWNLVSGFFVSMFESVWAGFINMIKPAIREMMEEFDERSFGIFEIENVDLIKRLSGAFGVPEDDLKGLLDTGKYPFPINYLFYVLTLFSTYGTYLLQASEILNQENVQNLLSKTQNQLPDLSALINAAFIAPEKTQEIRDTMKKYGFSDEAIDMQFLARYRLYNEEIIRVLFLREVLSDDEMFMRMRELGYTDTRIREMIQSWEVIPGPQDLFHMVAKEAFEPEFIQKIGLGAEFPEEQVEWLRKQGISEEWARKYWYAHWDQPSIQMGYEMLHRGVIDFDTLDLLFRATEIPPFWRDKLTAIAYQPYTRVDVRRMHDMGVLDDAQLIKAYKDLGYDDEHAYNMAVFTVKYNRQNDRELTKTQIINAYMEELMTRDDALDLLMGLDYTRDHADFILSFEEYTRERKYEEQAVKNIGDRYKNRLIDERQATVRLNEMNLPATRINLLLDTWKIDLFEDQKLPSKTDLAKLLKAKIITEDDYIQQMDLIGYNFKYTQWYLKLAKKGVT